jgi:hypothetical protein
MESAMSNSSPKGLISEVGPRDGRGYTPEDLRQLTEAGIVKCEDAQPGDASNPSSNELASA